MTCSWIPSKPIENCITVQWPHSEPVKDIHDLVSLSSCCQLTRRTGDKHGPSMKFDLKELVKCNSTIDKGDIVKLEINKISILSTSQRIEWYKVNENHDQEYVKTIQGSMTEDTDDLTMYLCIFNYESLDSCNHFSCNLIQRDSSEYWLFSILIEVRYTKSPSSSSSVACGMPEYFGPLLASLLSISNNKSSALPSIESIKENLVNLTREERGDVNKAQEASSEEAGEAKRRSTDACVVHREDDATNNASHSKVADALQSMDSRLSKIESMLYNMDSRMQRLEDLVKRMIHEPRGCS